MKTRIKEVLRRAARWPAAQRAMDGLAGVCSRLDPDGFPPRGHGVHLPLVVDAATSALLDQIPSETTPQERRFLFTFFRTLWSGRGHVIEVGPFLGGTTRAMALGMEANPRVSDGARLFTIDRFRQYYAASQLAAYVEPLLAKGLLTAADVEQVGASGRFLDLFTKLHAPHPYFRRVVALDRAVPSRPGEPPGDQPYLELERDMETEAVFVDGCKSWFGTKAFMREAGKVAVVGAHVIFQDFAWYTCFWLPVFVQVFSDHFRLVMHVDTTYVFSLTRPLDAATVDARFPDVPESLGPAALGDIMDTCVRDAAARGDRFARVRHTMQKAAALAYVGQKDQARTILRGLSAESWAAGHQGVLGAAMKAPTYRPDGAVTLD